MTYYFLKKFKIKIKNKIAFSAAFLSYLMPLDVISDDKTAYIDDVKYVPLRSGYSVKNRILNPAIKSGTEVTVLRQDEKSGFSKVVVADGSIGWLQTQHLTYKPISKDLLNKLEIDYFNLTDEFKKLSIKIENLKDSKNKADSLSISLEQKNKILNEKIAEIKKISSNAINLDKNNRALIEKNEMQKIQIAELQSDNARLADNSDKEWFLRGSLAVLIGVALAVILPKIRPKSRAKEWL